MTVTVTYCCQENNGAQQIDAEHNISLNLWVRNFCLRKNIGFFHFPPVNKYSLVNVTRLAYGECTSYTRGGFNYLNIHFTDDNNVPHVIILYYDPDWMEFLIDNHQGVLIQSIVFKKSILKEKIMIEQTQAAKPKMALCALDEDIQKALVNCPRYLTLEPLVELVKAEFNVIDHKLHDCETYKAIDKLRTELVDRVVCDDKVNIDVGRRQLLPYITYTQDVDGYLRVLIYKRGKRGDESRLHNLWSIGVGGHVEGDNANGQLIKTLCENMRQETLEEIGVDVDNSEFVHSLFNSMFILDSRQDTEIVHCGISVKVALPVDTTMTFEQGTIVEPQWVDVRTLKEMVTSGTIVLEAWSQLVLKYTL